MTKDFVCDRKNLQTQYVCLIYMLPISMRDLIPLSYR